MAQKGIKIPFEAEASPVKSALAQVDKSAKSLEKQLKDINKLLELDPTNVNLLAQKQDVLQKAVANTTTQLKGMEAAQNDITKGHQKWQENQQAIERNAQSIAKMTAQLDEAKSEMTAMWSAVGDGSASLSDYEAAAQKVASLTKNIEALNRAQKELKKDPNAINDETYQRYLTTTERLRINLQQLNTQQSQVSATIADGGRSAEAAARAEEEAARAAEAEARAEEERKNAVAQAAEAERKAEKAADNYKNSLNELKGAANAVKDDIKGMTTLMATGVAAVSAAVVKGTKDVSKVGMEFTSSMSNVQALSGATTEELEALRNAAADAGANTSKTASQAADALGYMALAGWDTTQMLEGLMPILRASEAGAMDLARCSDLVTDSMSSMGIAVGDLQHYLDVCTKTQSSANTSMEQLLQAYVSCGGMLKNLNVPMEESAAILGTLANRGIKGAEAGNALNSILVNLIGANKNAASAMKEMGISAFDANGNFIGLEATLKLVKSKIDEYGGDMEKISQLEAKLGGKTQLDTLMALLSGVSEEFDDLEVKITNCNGSLEETARTMQDNLTGDITSLQSALEGVENSIFESLEEPFRSAAQNATKELRQLNAACSEGELADSLKKIASAAGEMLSKVAKFAADDAFPALIKWLEWIADHSDGIISAITGVGAAWGTWKLGNLYSDLTKLGAKLIKTVTDHKAMVAAETEHTAAAAANTAAITANTAAQAANTTTDAANTTSETVNTAATTANTAATVADTAAESANTTATAANTTTQVANTAAQAANTAAQASGAAATAAASLTVADFTATMAASQAVMLGVAGVVVGIAAALVTLAIKSDEAGKRLKEQREELESLNDECERNKKATDDRIAASEAESIVLKEKADIYEKLRSEQNRTEAQEKRLQDLAEELQRYMPEGIQLIDKETGAYNSLADSIDNVIASLQKKARISAYEDELTNLYKEQLEAQKMLQEASRDYTAAINNDYFAVGSMYYNINLKEREKIYNDAADSLEAINERIEFVSQNIEKAYEEAYEPPEVAAGPTWAEAQAEKAKAEGERIAEQQKKNAELAKLGVKQTYDELQESLDKLDDDLAIHAVTEEDYWDKRRKLLEDSPYKEDKEWWKAYDKVTEHYDKLAETEKKAQEDADKKAEQELKKSIDDRISAVKERQELENGYTKEMMYNDMETIISGLDKESDLYKKYNSEILKGRKALNKESIDDQIAALKEKEQLNDDYTKEMMYNEMETIISGLDKESDLYKKYNAEIIKGRKALGDELAKQNAKQTKEQIDEAVNSVKEIQSKYNKMLSDVNSEQESYRKKLMDQAKLFTSDIKTDENGNKSGAFTLENIDKQIAAVTAYDNALTKLEKRGAGKNLINYIESQNAEDAENLKKMFSKMSDSELKAYSDKYDKLVDTVNKRSADRYAPQVQAINDGFVKEVEAVMNTLPPEMQKAGLDSIDGFIKGFTGDPDKLIQAVSDKCNEVLNTFKDGLDINSPSKETEAIGEYAGEGFEKGLLKFSGAEAAENFTDKFMEKLAEKDQALRDLMHNVFAGNAASAIEEMNAEANEALNNLASSFVLPDVTQLKVPQPTAALSAQGAGISAYGDTGADSQLVTLVSEIITYLSEIGTLLDDRAERIIRAIEIVERELSGSERSDFELKNILRELNKPIEVRLDTNVIGRAVMEYEHNYRRMIGI